MHNKESLMEQLEAMDINREGTVLVHSSYKSIGEVENRAETVLDAFSEYMKDGLLVFPTHTWSFINQKNPKFDVEESPSCVGILPELFRKRPGVVRSLHPTHSVAALGKDAVPFTSGDEKCDTPCARESAWGKLLDRQATILLVGVDLTRNTYMHGVEEWLDIPGRLTTTQEMLYTVLPDGTEISVPSYRHTGTPWSDYFWKVEEPFKELGAVKMGTFGDAKVMVCDTVKIYEILTVMLGMDQDVFSDNTPLEDTFLQDFYEEWERVRFVG
ncbi:MULTISPECIES: AAC(3) family N-acetyltransferase [Bacillaceae]|uniref:Aminoglycoside N(3)-acetyltransferase n=1 Tax=Evansella alkalicola TaxID=745819 RepID=A0ABS6JQA6_9BACI|nr:MULTISPECIES: AAC(3) family N-acetyltransferase [Bacillaceae]MBU9719894.1 AAC(3) family N-acetyltransferase [Bacillus alkalicola]